MTEAHPLQGDERPRLRAPPRDGRTRALALRATPTFVFFGVFSLSVVSLNVVSLSVVSLSVVSLNAVSLSVVSLSVDVNQRAAVFAGCPQSPPLPGWPWMT